MTEQKLSDAQARKRIERRIRRLGERHERQRLNLASLEAAYNLLGNEIKQAEEELARAG